MFDRNLLVVDVETSGSNTELSSVLQIGAIKLSQDLNQIDRPWLSYIKPYTNHWEAKAESVHGMKFDFCLSIGEDLEKGLTRFIDWIGNPKDYYIAQWSCGFDSTMLQKAFNFVNIKYPFSYRCFDIASITRWYLQSKGYSTKTGCFESASTLGIDTSKYTPHLADHDAMMAAECLRAVNNNVLG